MNYRSTKISSTEKGKIHKIWYPIKIPKYAKKQNIEWGEKSTFETQLDLKWMLELENKVVKVVGAFNYI